FPYTTLFRSDGQASLVLDVRLAAGLDELDAGPSGLLVEVLGQGLVGFAGPGVVDDERVGDVPVPDELLHLAQVRGGHPHTAMVVGPLGETAQRGRWSGTRRRGPCRPRPEGRCAGACSGRAVPPSRPTGRSRCCRWCTGGRLRTPRARRVGHACPPSSSRS